MQHLLQSEDIVTAQIPVKNLLFTVFRDNFLNCSHRGDVEIVTVGWRSLSFLEHELVIFRLKFLRRLFYTFYD
jgi:hypothetical protein